MTTNDPQAPPCPGCASTNVSVAQEWRLDGGARAIKCGGCDLLFTDPQPDDLDQYYAPEGTYQTGRNPVHALQARTRTKSAAGALFTALDAYFPASAPRPGASVLDFGCGSGIWLNSFQDRGWRTCGIEPGTDVAFVRHQRLTEIPLEPAFDLAIAYHVLEHLTRPLATLTQLAGALTPGGYCLISVPRLDTVAVHGNRKYCLNDKHHVVAFSEACLRGLCRRAGLLPVAALHHLDEAFTKGQPLRLRLLARKEPRE